LATSNSTSIYTCLTDVIREADGLALRAKLAPAFLSRLGLCPRHKVLDLKIGCGVEIAVREVAPPC
jgi:hypothetical protein